MIFIDFLIQLVTLIDHKFSKRSRKKFRYNVQYSAATSLLILCSGILITVLLFGMWLKWDDVTICLIGFFNGLVWHHEQTVLLPKANVNIALIVAVSCLANVLMFNDTGINLTTIIYGLITGTIFTPLLKQSLGNNWNKIIKIWNKTYK